jgi:UDP-arabinose 4-epimerase
MLDKERQTRGSIVVTGGAGFIGSHTCKALSKQGFLPVVYDNLSTGHPDAVRWGPLHHGDVGDTRRLAEVLQETRALGVMHFAASAYVGESVTDPQKYYRNNVGMVSVLDAMAISSVTRLVFSSSCATYGIPNSSPIDEECAQNPINPYGRTKLICEGMIEDFARANDFRYSILRYFNAAGADLDGDLVEHHDPETHLIPLALLAGLGVHDEIKIFGNRYPTRDGTCIRDFIHVADLAVGHVLALNHLLDGGSSFNANLGSGRGSSVLEIIGACEAALGQKIPTRIVDNRPGDPPTLIADVARARDLLGFDARYSTLPIMVESALAALRRLHRVQP